MQGAASVPAHRRNGGRFSRCPFAEIGPVKITHITLARSFNA